MMNLTILGSTGSIGTQTLEVVEASDNIKVRALGAGRNIKLLEEQIRAFHPRYACVADEKLAAELKVKVADTETEILSGPEGMEFLAGEPGSDTVIAAIVGFAGLVPSLAAAKAGKRLALANKETLVSGGDLVRQALSESGGEMIPVDSEHSAVFQCLEAIPVPRREAEVKQIILTASGGPFAGRTRKELSDITPEAALKHPNWDMGAKITIDSATLMNKGLEVLEAAQLFCVSADKIGVVVHRQSIIHSMIELVDGAVLAQLGVPDMKLPIQYALTYPERLPMQDNRLNLAQVGTLTFEEPDTKTFRCLALAYEAAKAGHTMPCVLNGANEVAVSLFLQKKIGFLDIAEILERVMQSHKVVERPELFDIIEADRWAREEALRLSQLS
ncbi:MAG: 1-deoxy-D-xylulose-5-phosphate reductoisomerase [Ruminococcaceae bacterium]|nr:1-deoxy-D-xylulose-5-phosphate reductoisomerase [Oscillospiraceae bacterium]